MARVEIYTKSWCAFCRRAKKFLAVKGIEFDEVDVTSDRDAETVMVARSGRRSVPQIFIDGRGIGGHDDLLALDGSGELDRLVQGPEATSKTSEE